MAYLQFYKKDRKNTADNILAIMTVCRTVLCWMCTTTRHSDIQKHKQFLDHLPVGESSTPPSFLANRFVQEVGQPSCIFCFGVFLFHAVAKMDKEKLWCIPHQPPLTLYTPLYYLSLILNLTLVSLVADYLLRFILTVTCCVLSGTWNCAHSLTWIIIKICAKHQHQLISWGKWQKKRIRICQWTPSFCYFRTTNINC